MPTNTEYLIQTLGALPVLDGRYERITCVNYDPVTQAKRGCFSTVFKAYDRLAGEWVALKFYDIEQQSLLDQYRRAAFLSTSVEF